MGTSAGAVARHVLDDYGRTFADELGIDAARNTPSPLFRLLTFSLLASARISHKAALQATDALARAGWRTADKMAQATWRERVDVLNHHGYARYDESTSRMLEDTAVLLLEEYRGDLRRLRRRASEDPTREKKLLMQCKGIGEVGAEMFLREVQVAWPEVYPFADRRVRDAAKKLGLQQDPKALARLAGGDAADLARLDAGLVRVSLERAWHRVKN